MSMDSLQQQAQQLLASGKAKAIIGWEAGTNGARPCVIRKADDAAKLIHDETCTHNLAAYLAKHEVKHLGPVALVAPSRVQRAVLQLVAERQLEAEKVLLLALEEGQVQVITGAEALEMHLALKAESMDAEDRALMDRLLAMSHGERWAFWQQEFSRCVKCYACRSSCPMCYCENCTMDCNRPQWVPVPSHAVGNLEYHMVRAMHLAGRCVECSACGSACPVGIPVHLLTIFAEESTRKQFGQQAGRSAKLDYALSTFKPDDKESFIR